MPSVSESTLDPFQVQRPVGRDEIGGRRVPVVVRLVEGDVVGEDTVGGAVSQALAGRRAAPWRVPQGRRCGRRRRRDEVVVGEDAEHLLGEGAHLGHRSRWRA